MLMKITRGDWEVNKNGKAVSITTKGGTYIGSASNVYDAKVMAASKGLLELLLDLQKENKELELKIKEIFKSIE